ncbi:unnamed protein product [Rotaria sordida]|uniref:Secreted protein n=1 Tax=Rotaria sordida TaxID=392033 RepID=A0A814EB07_9BILA|nr:unnamed protein product [Rotaria sordida]
MLIIIIIIIIVIMNEIHPDICPCSDDIDICLCCIPLNLLCCCLPCCRPPRDRVVYVQAAQPMHPTRDHSYIIREPISR